jgi:cytochrome c-type biogenesis protein CcmH/NrfF
MLPLWVLPVSVLVWLTVVVFLFAALADRVIPLSDSALVDETRTEFLMGD